MSERPDDDRDITWRVLRELIDAMPEERLDDVVEILPGDEHDEPRALRRVIGLNSIAYWSTCGDNGEQIENYTRSTVDNEHHPERYALLDDSNMFDEDGNWCFEWDLDAETYTGIPTGHVYVDETYTETKHRRKRIDNL